MQANIPHKSFCYQSAMRQPTFPCVIQAMHGSRAQSSLPLRSVPTWSSVSLICAVCPCSWAGELLLHQSEDVGVPGLQQKAHRPKRARYSVGLQG